MSGAPSQHNEERNISQDKISPGSSVVERLPEEQSVGCSIHPLGTTSPLEKLGALKYKHCFAKLFFA